MSEIEDFANSVPGFYKKNGVDQLLLLAWFVEARRQKSCFDGAYMRQCFRDSGADAPDMSVYLPRLAAKKPPQLICEKGGYRLAATLRRDFDKRFNGDVTIRAITQTLAALPAQVPNIDERIFLNETLSCYRAGAFRAATVMAWNLAYDHLTKWAVSSPDRLDALNDGIKRKMQGKAVVVKGQEDLIALNERTVVDCCQVGGLIDKNQTEILQEKLKRRNAAAHPSKVVIGQHQIDDTISDLVTNVVLALR
ncbi:hypothetical protein E5673_07845 [Sphingomonas sp. PAMC26645]|uniref:hypothetical protein n=1 Tax=Sphingomonas sp. PAMC26645 TaxID=2565555 RepID=UPI00109DE1D2|nr:hypothetical protein [Sphingomonas sp. PAMC26645]QCB42147.1 hypothetical protein E5673_07845 [Sphingomonas sp. PAMC26645]